MSHPTDRAGPALLRGRLRRCFLEQLAHEQGPTPQLSQLDELHARHLLTDQEYHRARRRLLGF